MWWNNTQNRQTFRTLLVAYRKAESDHGLNEKILAELEEKEIEVETPESDEFILM